jgi:hypothetical protein
MHKGRFVPGDEQRLRSAQDSTVPSSQNDIPKEHSFPGKTLLVDAIQGGLQHRQSTFGVFDQSAKTVTQ